MNYKLSTVSQKISSYMSIMIYHCVIDFIIFLRNKFIQVKFIKY